MEQRSEQIQLSQSVTNFYTCFAVGKGEDSDMVFSVSHYRNSTPDDLVEEGLDSAIEGILESTGGSLDYRTAFFKEGRSGVLWRISHPGDEVKTKGRIIYHNDHYLIIQVTFPADKSLNAKIDAFTESLRLTS